MHDLQQQRNLAYLFITHNLSVVRHMANRIVVMYLGRVAEAGPTEAIFDRPEHPYTGALLAANPDLADDLDGAMRTLEGSVPDPARPPQGCRFHTRCPVVTANCGWEVDDVVRWLADREGLFDTIAGVARKGAFEADLVFEHDAAVAKLTAALRSDAVPMAMREATEVVEGRGRKLHIRFRRVGEVQLTVRGPGHEAACVRTDVRV